jgi:hypothetical protein
MHILCRELDKIALASPIHAESTGPIGKKAGLRWRAPPMSERNRLSRRIKHYFHVIVPFLAEYFVAMRRMAQRNAMRNEEARIDLAFANDVQQFRNEAWTCVWPVLMVRPLFISAPIGILSENPPYLPGIESVPPGRQHSIAGRITAERSLSSIRLVFTLS